HFWDCRHPRVDARLRACLYWGHERDAEPHHPRPDRHHPSHLDQPPHHRLHRRLALPPRHPRPHRLLRGHRLEPRRHRRRARRPPRIALGPDHPRVQPQDPHRRRPGRRHLARRPAPTPHLFRQIAGRPRSETGADNPDRLHITPAPPIPSSLDRRPPWLQTRTRPTPSPPGGPSTSAPPSGKRPAANYAALSRPSRKTASSPGATTSPSTPTWPRPAASTPPSTTPTRSTASWSASAPSRAAKSRSEEHTSEL